MATAPPAPYPCKVMVGTSLVPLQELLDGYPPPPNALEWTLNVSVDLSALTPARRLALFAFLREGMHATAVARSTG